MNEGPIPAEIPLLIGVTGHRDLRPDELPAIEKAARGLLKYVAATSQYSSQHLVSPLAEGADQLVARVALDEGWSLVALLPLPVAIYREDFITPDARQQFDDLLGRAVASLVMPPTAGGAWDTFSRGDLDRPSQYAAAGCWLARNVNLLIAVWDGTETGKTGGTADHGRESRTTSYPPPGGSVAHILAGRVSTKSAAAPGTLRLLPDDPRGSACDALRDGLVSWIDRFNAGAER
jgi:hypothetical protein